MNCVLYTHVHQVTLKLYCRYSLSYYKLVVVVVVVVVAAVVGHMIVVWDAETSLLHDVLSVLFLRESTLCLVMKLRNSKVVLLSSASVSLRRGFQFDAHQDAEVSYCRVSMDSTNVSSDLHKNAAATTGLLSAECLLSGMKHSWRKWTYKDNIELMHCFYLAKLDEVGYRDRLKGLWDLCYPANIQLVLIHCAAMPVIFSYLIC